MKDQNYVVSSFIEGEEITREEFEKIVKPVIKFLNENGHPHMSIRITPTSAILESMDMAMETFEFVKD